MFRDRWECAHIGTVIFVVQAALLVPYIIIGVMGGGTAPRHHRRADSVSGRRRPRRAGGDELCVLRRDARHGLGQRLPDRAVPVVRRHRADRDQPQRRRLPGADERTARRPVDVAAADAAAHLALVLLQLHVHSALDHRLSAHRDLLHDGEEAGAVQAHRRVLSDLYPGDLATVRLPRRGRQRDDLDAADRRQASGAPDARRRACRHARRGSCGPAPPGRRETT